MKTRNIILILSVVGILVFVAVSVFGRTKDKAASIRTYETTGKDVPGQMNYQGYLVDSSDSSAITDTLEMIFRIYDAETNGSELWSETHGSVLVGNGLFNALLGTPAALFTGQDLWIETTIGGETLSPRKKLVSVPYAFKDECWTSSGDNCYFDKSGSVGIGTTNPQGLFQVAEPFIVTTEEDVGISGAGDPEFTPDAKLEITPGGIDRDLLMLSSNAAGDGDVVIVKNSGDVGIGTTDPAAQFDVHGGFYFYGGSGDAQTDDDLDQFDAIYIVNYLAGINHLTPEQRAEADVNGDNSIDHLDAELIMAYLGGEITWEEAHHDSGKAISDRAIIIWWDEPVEKGEREVRVGILEDEPESELHVNGTAQMTGFKLSTGAVDGFVLTTDAEGMGTWRPASGGGGIGGGGDANYIAKFVDSTTIDNSGIYEIGGNVGIGTTDPNSQLSVGGDGDPRYGVYVNTMATSPGAAGVYAEVSSLDPGNDGAAVVGTIRVTPGGGEHIGVRGDAYSEAPLGDSRTYGVHGRAGNATPGWNYGVYGELDGINDGSAVCGVDRRTHPVINNPVPGAYAGYFVGDVSVSGEIGSGVPAKLNVNNVLRLEPRAAAPTDPQPGDMYIDASDGNRLKVYDGAEWHACW